MMHGAKLPEYGLTMRQKYDSIELPEYGYTEVNVLACTFFGHRNCSEGVKSEIFAVLQKLINEGVNVFYVGTHGNFDFYALSVLRKMKELHPQITYMVVLAYMPSESTNFPYDEEETVFPEGIEKAPKRFAISYRNRWMLKKSDYVVAYVTHTYGGAASFVKKAMTAGKTVINLAENE